MLSFHFYACVFLLSSGGGPQGEKARPIYLICGADRVISNNSVNFGPADLLIY
jgi:hypothetical protein